MWYEFPAPVILEIRGKDARRYLNNRLSADLRMIQPSNAVQAAALNPQGRIEAVFLVCCVEADAFLLAATGGARDGVLSAVARYKVADRVSIEDASERYRFFHVTSDVFDVEAAMAASLVVFTVRRLPSKGVDVVVPREKCVDLDVPNAWGEALDAIQFDRLRFRAGSPLFPVELNEDSILTECGQRDVVSFSKGCYVGQEVIERSDAIGRLPRKLERIIFEVGEPIPAESQVVAEDAQVIGKIVSSFVDSEGSRVGAFAMLRTGKYHAGMMVLSLGRKGRIVDSEGIIE